MYIDGHVMAPRTVGPRPVSDDAAPREAAAGLNVAPTISSAAATLGASSRDVTNAKVYIRCVA